jgi:hypothetical protein
VRHEVERVDGRSSVARPAVSRQTTVTEIETVDWFPARSVATTVIAWEARVAVLVPHIALYGLDPSLLRRMPSTEKVTDAIPEAAFPPVPRSVAAAVIDTLVPRLTEAPSCGDVIATVGAAASTLTVTVFTVSRLPATSREKNFTVVVWVIKIGAM